MHNKQWFILFYKTFNQLKLAMLHRELKEWRQGTDQTELLCVAWEQESTEEGHRKRKWCPLKEGEVPGGEISLCRCIWRAHCIQCFQDNKSKLRSGARGLSASLCVKVTVSGLWIKMGSVTATGNEIKTITCITSYLGTR